MLKYGPAVVILMITVVVSEQTYEVEEPHVLREFHDYGNVYFNQFTIPDGTSWAIWTVTLLSNPLQMNCKENNVTASLYLQYGGYPIFTPFDESFPPTFLSNSAYAIKLNLSTESPAERRFDMFVRSPTAGRWFSASYIDPQFTNKMIRPQGFSVSECGHFLRISIQHSTASLYTRQPIPVGLPRTVIVEDTVHVISYFIDKHVYRYNITVLDCKVLVPLNGTCHFYLLSQEQRPPILNNKHSIECDWGNSTNCQLTIEKPMVNRWHYTAVTSALQNASVSFSVSIMVSVEACKGDLMSVGWCSVDNYYTDTLNTDSLSINYAKQMSLFVSPAVIVRDDKPYIASFNIESLVHGGGTLKYLLEVHSPVSSNHAVIYSCVSSNRLIIDTAEIISCAETANTTMEYMENGVTQYHVPYPQSGTWYVSVIAQCYDPSTHNHTSCIDTIAVYANVTIRKCIDNQCGPYGTCYLYSRGVLYWSVCRCKAGYRGYGCTDDSEAISRALQVLEMLLLIISNILFGVAGAWAIYLKLFSEALVYFFVLFASSFYHACDNGTIYAVCVVKYSLLQYCDFYGSILAVWITAMAMSEIPPSMRSVLHLAGVFGILIGTQASMSGLWNFVIPLIIAAVILATSWARVCKRDKSCYPKRKVWLIQVVPGIGSALIGLALYSFVETDSNYFYVHSIWHLLMATAVIFLLPRDNKLSCSALRTYFTNIRLQRRRNDVTDERTASHNLTVSIVGSSDRTDQDGSDDSGGGGSVEDDTAHVESQAIIA